MERFVPKNGVKRMNFPLYFQKVIWVGGGVVFLSKILSEKAKHPRICPDYAKVLGVTCLKPNSVTALLPSLPSPVFV